MAEAPRLYKFFKPTRYELNIKPDKQKMIFCGSVNILGRAVSSTNNLRLHSKDLNISEATVNGTKCSFKCDSKLDELIINLPKKAIDPTNLKVSLRFSGGITKQLHGLYPCVGRDGEIILATQFESHFAREVFPCIDEPEAKAVFALTLNTPKNEVVLANTEPLNTIYSGDTAITVFKDTPVMPTYLLAFVCGKIEYYKTTTKNGVLVRAWSTPDQLPNTKFALDVTKKSLEFYEDYFGISYPLEKCDIVALPDFAAGAMENWGLLTFRETCMLVDHKNTSLDTKQYVAMVVAHEVAHQWFGNLVTMRWWNDLWLNEGFASWIEFMAVDKIFPDWHIWTHFIVTDQLTAFRLDALNNTHAIEVDVPSPDEIQSIFDSISYAKGACMIHMLHEFLGKDNFRSGLSHYLKKYAYKNTRTADLWEALRETSGLPVAEFMGAWTSQKGFPYIDLVLNGNGLTLAQQRFLSSGKQLDDSSVWPIPLLSDAINKDIFDTKTQEYKVPNSNLRLNKNQAGFYITKYWPEAYELHAQKISSKEFTEPEKIGIVSDTLALTKAGRLSAVELLTILEAFGSETSAPVWDSVAVALGDIRHILGESVRESMKPFTRYLVKESLISLGWHAKTNESHYDTLLRPLILGLASGADDAAVASEAKKEFDEANYISDIEPDLRNMVIASVSHRGGSEEYKRMVNMLKTAKSPEDHITLAHGLTNFRHKSEYQKSLQLIRSDNVRLQDVSYWIIYALANPAARQATWEWLKQNWAWLKQNMAGDPVYSRLPIFVARSFCDNNFLLEYKAFFDNVREPSLDRAIEQGIETIETQFAWRKRDEKVVQDWLKGHSYTN